MSFQFPDWSGKGPNFKGVWKFARVPELPTFFSTGHQVAPDATQKKAVTHNDQQFVGALARQDFIILVK
jgi:hypothetical protein